MNRKMRIAAVLVAVFALAGGLRAQATLTSQQILANMDKAGKNYPYLEASVERTKHFAATDDYDTEKGKVYFGRAKNPMLRLDLEVSKPREYSMLLRDGKGTRYDKKDNRVQFRENLGDFGELLLILFGQWTDAAAKRFDLKVGSTQALDGRPTVILDLLPKTKEVSGNFTSIRLWVDTERWITIQTQANERGKDTQLMKLGNITRGGSIKTSVFDLKIPKNAIKG